MFKQPAAPARPARPTPRNQFPAQDENEITVQHADEMIQEHDENIAAQAAVTSPLGAEINRRRTRSTAVEGQNTVENDQPRNGRRNRSTIGAAQNTDEDGQPRSRHRARTTFEAEPNMDEGGQPRNRRRTRSTVGEVPNMDENVQASPRIQRDIRDATFASGEGENAYRQLYHEDEDESPERAPVCHPPVKIRMRFANETKLKVIWHSEYLSSLLLLSF